MLRAQVNSLEQLCINYANEKLQQHFNKCIFLQVESSCDRNSVHPTPDLRFDGLPLAGARDVQTRRHLLDKLHVHYGAAPLAPLAHRADRLVMIYRDMHPSSTHGACSYTDVQSCINLLDDKRQGVFALLDEECRLPKGTDLSFVRKLDSLHGSELLRPPLPSRPKEKGLSKDNAFVVKHYAAEVQWLPEHVCRKNNRCS